MRRGVSRDMKTDNTWRNTWCQQGTEHVIPGYDEWLIAIRWLIQEDLSIIKQLLCCLLDTLCLWGNKRSRYIYVYIYIKPIPLAARSKAWIWAVRLLGLWVQIPPGVWMSVCCECCVLPGRGLCIGLVTRSGESDRVWCVQWVWSRGLVRGGHDSELDRSATEKNYIYIYIYIYIYTHTHTHTT